MMTSIKVKYKNDIRRVTIPLPLSYDKLREILNVLFSHTPNFPQHYGIKYVDDEGDHISITTDLELEEACSFSKRSGSAILRMFVVPANVEGAEGTEDLDKPRLIDFEHNPAQPSSVFTHSQLVSIDQILKASSEPPCPSISSSSSITSNSSPSASPSLKKELSWASQPEVKPDEPAKPATPAGSISGLPTIPAPLPGAPYNAIFVADVGIQDGQTVAPGTEITKTWKIKNTGASAWPEGVRLINTLGDALGPSTTPIINLANPGETVEVSATLKVPNNAGRYVSYFRFHTPEGVPFGHRIWADVIVEEVEKQETEAQMDIEPVEPVVEPVQSVVQPVQSQPVHVPAPVLQPVHIPAPQPTVQPIPVVVAQPQPVHIAAPQPDPVEEKINVMVQMGFYSRDKNREMLQKTNFNVEEAINLMLGD